MNNVLRTWQAFTAAPHRVMFFSGAVQGVATMLWWLFELSGRYGLLAHPGAWVIPSIWAHAYLMIYGFLPFFIFGFLFTTYPNWMNGEKVLSRYYIPAFLFMMAGVILFYTGLFLDATLLMFSVMLMMTGWAIALYALVRVQVRAAHPDKRHPAVTSLALTMGWLGMAGYLYWLMTGQAWALEFARTGGIWFFLLPIFVTVSHRMVPFFSSRVLANYSVVRPYWVLWLMLGCMLGHGVLQLGGGIRYLWLFDLPLAIAALSLTYFWKIWLSFQVRLLAVLHVAFLWLGLASVLYAAQSFVLFYSGGSQFILGLGPLHALVIGFFTSMMLGMVSRVTLGHSGQELAADAVTWLLFWGMQTVALIRVLPEVFAINGAGYSYLLVSAAMLWLASMLPWVVKYAPNYWRPRADGKPG